MRLVPTHRLIQALGAVLLPCAFVLAFAPQYAVAAGGVAGLTVIFVLADGARALGSLDGVRAFVSGSVRATRGLPVEIEVTIEQPKAMARVLNVGLGLPDSVESEQDALRVRMPGDVARASVIWKCTPGERGSFKLDRLYLGAASPWTLWECRRAVPVGGVLRVYPNVQRERKNLAALFLDRAPYGVHARRHVGKGREFEHLREYVPGDSFEDIHWKATARRGEPVTKMYQVERTQEVYVAIDSSRLSSAVQGDGSPEGTTTNLERFVNAALVLGLAAEKQGDLFGLITFDRRVNRFIKARTGRGHYNACRDAIFDVEPTGDNPDFAELFSFIRVRLRKRALLVVLTNLSDPLLAEQFNKHVELVSRNHLVFVNSIADPAVQPVFGADAAAKPDDVYARLAGHIEWTNLQRLRQGLRLRNVALQFVPQEALSANLVSQYVSQKQRQLL